MEKCELLSQVNFMKTWQPWNNDVKYALCVSNMPNAVPSFEQLPASNKPPLWNPNNLSFLPTPCVWRTYRLSSRSKIKFWMLITFKHTLSKKWHKMAQNEENLIFVWQVDWKDKCKTHTVFWEKLLIHYRYSAKQKMCNIILSQFVPSRIQADLFKLKDNLQLPNHVCLWSQSSTLKVDVCPGLVCKLNSGTISKYLALNKFERKINSNSNLANNVMSLTPRYTAD